MVQEKDAAKKRVQARKDAENRQAKELEANTIRFAWYVVELTPGYNTGGYYDQDVKAKHQKVSDTFDTEREAVAWMDAHEADEGNTLYVQRVRLIRRTYTDWVTY